MAQGVFAGWVLAAGLILAPPADERPQVAQFIVEVNQMRLAAGLGTLKPDPLLAKAAQGHSDAMVDHDFFGHVGPGDADLRARLDGIGYDYRVAAENLAAGQPTPGVVVARWLNSEGHRANLLRRDVSRLGVGYAYAPYDQGFITYKHYWTLIVAESGDR